MGAKAFNQPTVNLYDQDFVAWTEETARLLRERRFDAIEVAHLAQEIEDMGKSDLRELESRLTVVILHLLKWQFQPGKRTGSWQSTIIAQRTELLALLQQSPSLRRKIAHAIRGRYLSAVLQAAAETGLLKSKFPKECPFTAGQLLDQEFFPER